jgi:hypothetical protein
MEQLHTKNNNMKKLLYLSIAIIGLSFTAKQSEIFSPLDGSEEEIIIDIIQGSSTKDNDLSKHKVKDVDVFKEMRSLTENEDPKQCYSVNFYFNLGDGLSNSSSIIISDDLYTKASVKWLNDSTIAVNLFNPESEDSYAFEAWGTKNGTSGMTYD